MKAISTKIFEDFATSEFLRDNILDFQFVTSNRTKEELTWKIVRNTTVLNRFIPFYVKDLFKEEVIFLCNELHYSLIHPDYKSGLKDCFLNFT